MVYISLITFTVIDMTLRSADTTRATACLINRKQNSGFVAKCNFSFLFLFQHNYAPSESGENPILLLYSTQRVSKIDNLNVNCNGLVKKF